MSMVKRRGCGGLGSSSSNMTSSASRASYSGMSISGSSSSSSTTSFGAVAVGSTSIGGTTIGGGATTWGCDSISSFVIIVVILILIVILSQLVKFGLSGYLHDQHVARHNHQLKGCVLLLQLLDGFLMLPTNRLQLCDPSVGFCSLVDELTDMLHCLVELLI
jgi:uncharacterized membrane protein